jgi:fucose permease
MEEFLGTLLAVVIGKAVYDGSKSKLPPEQQKAVNRHFTKYVVLPFIVFGVIVFLISLVSSAFAQTTQQTFRDSSGRVTGYATTNNAGTVYRNSLGQNTGRAVTNNAGTTFYNERGQVTGRSSGARR